MCACMTGQVYLANPPKSDRTICCNKLKKVNCTAKLIACIWDFTMHMSEILDAVEEHDYLGVFES